MKYKILWLIQSVSDMQRIREYIDQFDLDAGYRIANELYASTGRLAEMPRMFAEYNRITALRRMVVGDYSIFYRIDEEKKIVKIEKIRHHYEDSSSV